MYSPHVHPMNTSIRDQGMDKGWTEGEMEDRLMPTRIYKVERSTASLKGFMKEQASGLLRRNAS
jgi:hypothetical protein